MKKSGHLSNFQVPFLRYDPWIVSKSAFLQFFADLSQKFKSIKAIYIYASDRSCYAFSENGIVYCAMTYCFGDISVWSRRILLNFCWVSIFFDILSVWSQGILLNFCWVTIFFGILIVNILWTVAQTPINHSIFWKSVMRTLRWIYVNCLKRLRFLVEVSTKL